MSLRIERRIDGPLVRLVEAGVLHLADNADDDGPRTLRAPALLEPLAQHVAIRKEAPRPRAIDHDRLNIGRGHERVARVEQTTLQQVETEQLEVARRDRYPRHHRLRLS